MAIDNIGFIFAVCFSETNIIIIILTLIINLKSSYI